MANKRLSKLQTRELEPSEIGLTDDDGHELTLSGVLSLTTEENMDGVSGTTNGKGNYFVIFKDIILPLMHQ